MKSKVFLVSVAAFLFITSLYGGAFAMHYFEWGHWAKFPTFITSFTVWVSSIALGAFGAVYGE